MNISILARQDFLTISQNITTAPYQILTKVVLSQPGLKKFVEILTCSRAKMNIWTLDVAYTPHTCLVFQSPFLISSHNFYVSVRRGMSLLYGTKLVEPEI